jgi:transporter family protein
MNGNIKEWIPASLCVLALWSVWGFLPKVTTKLLPPQSVFLYEVVGVVLLGLFVLGTSNFRPAFNGSGAILAIMTGACGAGGGLAYLYAASRGPISMVSIITAMYPALIVVAAYFFLGETLSARQIVGCAFAVLALVLLAT